MHREHCSWLFRVPQRPNRGFEGPNFGLGYLKEFNQARHCCFPHKRRSWPWISAREHDSGPERAFPEAQGRAQPCKVSHHSMALQRVAGLTAASASVARLLAASNIYSIDANFKERLQQRQDYCFFLRLQKARFVLHARSSVHFRNGLHLV